jgi:hypothetical protein
MELFRESFFREFFAEFFVDGLQWSLPYAVASSIMAYLAARVRSVRTSLLLGIAVFVGSATHGFIYYRQFSDPLEHVLWRGSMTMAVTFLPLTLVSTLVFLVIARSRVAPYLAAGIAFGAAVLTTPLCMMLGMGAACAFLEICP